MLSINAASEVIVKVPLDVLTETLVPGTADCIQKYVEFRGLLSGKPRQNGRTLFVACPLSERSAPP